MHLKLPTPKDHSVEILLFRNVNNSAQLLEQVLKGEFAASFVNAVLIPDEFVLLVATTGALRRDDDEDKITRKVFTEILYHLSPTRNISQSLKTFGITDKTTDMFIIIPDSTPETLSKIRQQVDGTECEPTPKQIQLICDEAQVRAVYAIDEAESKSSTLLHSVLSRMACRDVNTSHKMKKR